MLKLDSGKSGLVFTGTGPGARSRDGCSVEFYRQSDVGQEPGWIESVAPPPANLLELGCGAGRVTGALVEAGYQVTAVDNSEDMLSHVEGAALVLSDIESLTLDQTFDVVTLASYLLNSPLPETREGFLRTVKNHLAPSGVALFEVNHPGILDSQVGMLRDDEEAAVGISEFQADGSHISMTLTYRKDDQNWSHSFETFYFTEEELRSMLAGHGLEFGAWINEGKTWFSAAAK